MRGPGGQSRASLRVWRRTPAPDRATIAPKPAGRAGAPALQDSMNRIPERIGKYRIIKEIGRGATAVVYLAETPDYPEPVALKHVRFDDKARDEAKWNRRLIKLLKAERVVSGRLDHPNIIRIHDASIEPDEAYVVMEYFPGGSLERYCSFQNLLPIHRTIGIVFKCCMALDHAYRQGIVHRDIKPANILVDEQDNVKITDFGLALNINKKLDTDSTFIMGVGSPAYMSPEQAEMSGLDITTIRSLVLQHQLVRMMHKIILGARFCKQFIQRHLLKWRDAQNLENLGGTHLHLQFLL